MRRNLLCKVIDCLEILQNKSAKAIVGKVLCWQKHLAATVCKSRLRDASVAFEDFELLQATPCRCVSLYICGHMYMLTGA